MKKLTILGFVLSMFVMLSSCNSQKAAANQSENLMRGDWVLSQVIGNDAKNIVIAQVLGQAPVDCFEGSTWHLVANNSSGYYTLDGARCPSYQNKISWHMASEDGNVYFWFKRIAEGEKAKNVKSGYKLKVVSIDDYQAHLSQEVPVEGGGKTVINYYFNKQ